MYSVEDQFIRIVKIVTNAVVGVMGVLVILLSTTIYFLYFYQPSDFNSSEENLKSIFVDLADVKDGIHTPTGLKADENFDLVISNCTPCHSAKLITQNRATREGWENTIVWMQETQNLWDLGDNKEKIISYLARNYAPDQQGRRRLLENIKWYELKNP